MFGPESTATERPRTHVESRSPVRGSSPFVRLSTGAVPGRPAATSAKTVLGTASTITSTSPGASASGTAVTLRRSTFGIERGFRPVSVIACACSAEWHASTTSWPRSSSTRVNDVPQDPAPATRKRTGRPYARRTKSIETGTPSRPKRSRSSFSTQ